MTPHPRLLNHFQSPRNAGTLASSTAVRVQTENPACGDIIVLYAEWNEAGNVSEVRYQVRGCTAAIAAGSALTTLIQGRSRAQLQALQTKDIEEELGELQPASKHAAVLCIDAVTNLLKARP